MVQPTGLEPVTSSFAGRRSNPTELRLQIIGWFYGILWNFKFLFQNILITSWHTIEIKSFQVNHRFCNIIFLFSLLEKSSFIEYSLFDKCIDIFCRELFLRKSFLILHVSSSLFIGKIKARLFIFISCIDKCRLFLSFRKLSCSCLFFYESCRESVTVCHEKKIKIKKFSKREKWSGETGSNRHTQGLKP